MKFLRGKAVVAIDEGAGRGRRRPHSGSRFARCDRAERDARDMEAVVEDRALPLREVITEFPGLNVLVVAMAYQQAARLTEP